MYMYINYIILIPSNIFEKMLMINWFEYKGKK